MSDLNPQAKDHTYFGSSISYMPVPLFPDPDLLQTSLSIQPYILGSLSLLVGGYSVPVSFKASLLPYFPHNVLDRWPAVA